MFLATSKRAINKSKFDITGYRLERLTQRGNQSSCFHQQGSKLGKDWMFIVCAIEDLAFAVIPKDQAGTGQRGQLPLNGPHTAMNVASQLPNEEGALGPFVQRCKKASARPSKEQVA
jgi:hypothetical protein